MWPHDDKCAMIFILVLVTNWVLLRKEDSTACEMAIEGPIVTSLSHRRPIASQLASTVTLSAPLLMKEKRAFIDGLGQHPPCPRIGAQLILRYFAVRYPEPRHMAFGRLTLSRVPFPRKANDAFGPNISMEPSTDPGFQPAFRAARASGPDL